jgi:hypothetical protein
MTKQEYLNLIINYCKSHLCKGYRSGSSCTDVEYFHSNKSNTRRGTIIGCYMEAPDKIKFCVDAVDYVYDGQCKPSKRVDIGKIWISPDYISKEELMNICKVLRII